MREHDILFTQKKIFFGLTGLLFAVRPFARLILWMEADYGWNRWRAYDILTHVARTSMGYYGLGTMAAKIEKRYLQNPG